MNKVIKTLIVILNVIMTIIAFSWFKKEKGHEPLIALIAPIGTLLGIFLDSVVSNIITKDVTNKSKVKVDVASGDNVTTEKISDSEVDIKTHK